MKKTEAISILATSVRPREAKDRARYDEAVKMAIELMKCSETPKSSDCISRRAAIDALDKRFDDVPMELTTEILQLRRDLRERIPSAQPATSCSEIPNGSDDTISRQAAIELCDWYDNPSLHDDLEKLPPAQPEQKRGKWIYNSPVTMKCDQCGFAIKDWDWHRFKICPNCGADMRGEQDEAD